MKRSKKVVFACHCLLNQNARAQGVAKCAGVVREFVDHCIANNYGIVPIDCPQLYYEPIRREPATKELYDNRRFRLICNSIARSTVELMKRYLAANYSVCGVYGIEGSPSCGAVRTHVMKDGKSTNTAGRGIFMEELSAEMEKEGLGILIYDWDIERGRAIR